MTHLATRFAGRAPFEEVWFIELRAADGQGLWLRHTLSAGAHAEAAVWAVHHAGPLPTGWHAPGRLLDAQHDAGVLFRRDDAELTPTRARGRCGPLTWDLTLHGGGMVHRHVPRLLERLGLGRTYEPGILDLTVRGTVMLDGRALPFDGARGVLGHLHGRRNRVERWAWCHASGFEGAADVVFEGLCAQLGSAPPLTSMALFLPDGPVRLSTLPQLVGTRSHIDQESWHAVGRRGDTKITATMTLPRCGVALAAYTDSDGRPSWCRNAVDNRLVVRLDHGGSTRTPVSNRAIGELGTRTRPQGAVTVPPT